MFLCIYSFEILKRNVSVFNDGRKRMFQQIQERSLFSWNYVFSAHVLQHNANIKLFHVTTFCLLSYLRNIANNLCSNTLERRVYLVVGEIYI